MLLWKLKFLSKCLPIKNSGIISQSWKSSSNNLFTQEHCIFVILFLKSTFLNLLFHSHCKSTMVNFCLFPLPNEVFLYFVHNINCIIMEFRINKTCTTLEIAKDFKIVILPSIFNCPMHHNFKMFSVLAICSEKLLSCSKFLLYEKWTPSIFTVLLLRLTHFMPQSATWTPFRTPIPAI